MALFVYDDGTHPFASIHSLTSLGPSGACSIHVHDVFGPTVAYSCLNGFDFTLLFEESILTLLPLLLTGKDLQELAFSIYSHADQPLVVILIPRALLLRKSPRKVTGSWHLALKSATFAIYISLQIALLALWAGSAAPTTRLTLATTIITIGGFCWLLYMSCLEHNRSVRPSTLLCLYFGISSVVDLARLRTLFFIPGCRVVAPVHLASFFVKLALLALEVAEKRRLLVGRWKDASPEAAASFYSRVFFVWLNPLFLKGYRNRLTVDYLTPLDEDILAASRPIELQERWEKADRSSKNALLWIFVRHYKWELLAGVIPRLAYIGFAFTEPFLVERVLDFVSEPAGPNTRNFGYGLVGAYFIVHVGKAVQSQPYLSTRPLLSLTWYEHMTYRVLTQFRGSLVSLIYDKTLRLSASAVTDAEAITLMSADIDRIGLCMRILHDSYASVIEVVLSLCLLYRLLGIAVIPSTVFISVCLSIGIPLASAAGNAQVPWLEAIEKRLAVTSKMLGGIKAIRMAGLTEKLHEIVTSLRRVEIRASRRFRLFSVCETGAANSTFTFAPVLGLGAYIILAKVNGTKTLTEGVAFAALSLFQLQDQPVITMLHGFEDFQTIVNSFDRVQTYILSTVRQDPRITPVLEGSGSLDSELSANNAGSSTTAGDSVIAIKDGAAGYSADENIIKAANLAIGRGKITMIVGPVGSGKSTLLRLILGELPNVSGSVAVGYSKCAFCPQSAWITWGTVQSNIVGMTAWDPKWYDTVVRACSLVVDFEELPDGDQTMTGTRGSRLSGGQQMRVVSNLYLECVTDVDAKQSLARALYSRNLLVVLDDVLTGLDRITEAHILDAVFSTEGLLKQTPSTVVVATNSGTLSQTVVLSVNHTEQCVANHLRYADHIIVLNKEGCIAEQGTLEQVSASGSYVKQLESMPVVQTARPEPELLEETHRELGLPDEEDKLESSHKTSDFQAGVYYAQMAGKGTIAIYLCICAAYIFGLSSPCKSSCAINLTSSLICSLLLAIWLQWWTDANAKYPNENIGYWLGVYLGLAALAVISCMASDWYVECNTQDDAKQSGLSDDGRTQNVTQVSPNSAQHNLAVREMFTLPLNGLEANLYCHARATTSFLTSTNAGRTTNRFSQDLQLIDSDLPQALDTAVVCFFSVIVSAVLVCTGSGYVAAAIPACICIVATVQVFYLRTSRQLRLLDIETKAPLFSHFIETLGGLTCIRAYGWSKEYKERSYLVLDTSQKPYYLLWCIQRWLTLVLDLMGGAIAVMLVALATSLPNGSTGLLGVALFNVINFSGVLQTFVTEWTQLETALGAISRIKAFVQDTPSENAERKRSELPEEWPSVGSLVFENVSASYETSATPVLDGINLTIRPGEKIALCGRTGSGKSSFLLTILRMLDISEGSISIDGHDINKLSREDLRKRLNTLPQEVFFLHGSVRENIDPLQLSTDKRLIDTLRAVRLWHMFEGRGGLDAPASEEALSHGQRQLFCLGRAIARPGNIVIIDEATSSVDAETDKLMQRVLREELRGRTLIAVAHKLQTVLDFDRIVMMEKGRIAESGNPRELLAAPDSSFSKLYTSMATETAE
ncbi:hypothetical protein PG994_007346 [Apiospora phragmitis]|uniref:ABC transporter n=1 Tax=Apiospora phragmitis TaxID=2905665 RepID=A0ABR1V0I7_9PEZI